MVVNPGERDGVANTVGDNVGTFDGSKVILELGGIEGEKVPSDGSKVGDALGIGVVPEIGATVIGG